MKENKKLPGLLYVVGSVAALLGALMKTQGVAGASVLFFCGIIATLSFIAFALNEIYRSSRIDRSDKITWTILFFFFSTIAGIVYLFNSRKYIVSAK